MKTRASRAIFGVVACLLLTLIGAVTGLGYMTYCAFFSGVVAGEYELSTEHPCEFELTPEMSPVAITAGVTFVVPRGQFSRRHAVYDGELRRGREIVWSGQFGASIDDEDYPTSAPLREPFEATRRYVLPTIDVSQKAVYSFAVQESLDVDLKVRQMPLTVRRNVTRANITVVVAGCIAMGLGILGLVFFGIRAIRGAL